MANDQVTIILFKDGSFSLDLSDNVDQSHYGSGARFFRAPDQLELVLICEWIGRGYNWPDIVEYTLPK